MIWRWIAVRGQGARAVHHLVSSWQPPMGGSVRFDTACGSQDSKVTILEPDGRESCVACYKHVVASD